jgi:site-specific recombinase XerC
VQSADVRVVNRESRDVRVIGKGNRERVVPLPESLASVRYSGFGRAISPKATLAFAKKLGQAKHLALRQYGPIYGA